MPPDLSPTVIDGELAERRGQILIRFLSLEYWITLLLATLLQADHGPTFCAPVVQKKNPTISNPTSRLRPVGHIPST